MLEEDNRGILHLTCADEGCDAEADLSQNDNFGIVQNIILPYFRITRQGKTIYKTRLEQKRINRFLAEHKENAMREGMEELEKELCVYQKLLKKSLGTTHKLKIQRHLRRLERDKKDCQMAALVL